MTHTWRRAALALSAALLLAAAVDADTRHPGMVRAFQRLSGYPHGRIGYVVDHRIPLCAGGPDTIDNMQWQQVSASYVKDAFERHLCQELARQGYRLMKVEGHP